MPKQHEQHISEKECFMEIAKITARRSKDPRSQNGAVIASYDGRILSAGYNGFPYVKPGYGNNDDIYSWDKSDDFIKDRLSYVVHAEANAILNFRGISREMENGTIYVTQIPCNECAKLIVQSGIKKVIYLNDEDKPRTEVTKRILHYAGVELEQFDNNQLQGD
jgi:dCMP deaminase